MSNPPINPSDEPDAQDTAAIDAAVARSLDPTSFEPVPGQHAEPVAETAEGSEHESPWAPPAESTVADESDALAFGVVQPAADARHDEASGGSAVAPVEATVAAPVPPKPRGNRGFASAVVLLGSGVFAALDAIIVYLFMTITGTVRHFVDFVQSPIFWGTVAVFFLAWLLLGLVINRGAAWAHAVFSWLVAAVVYLAAIGLTLVAVRAWNLTSAEVSELLRQSWFSPYPIIAAVLAREIPLWFGSWIARNGRRVRERNTEALDAYERELADGPVFPEV